MKTIYKFIIIICLLLLLFMFYKNVEIFTQCNYKHPLLNDVSMNMLNVLLDEFIDFSNKNNIPYFFIAGSLLGIERNGGLLPTDDDIDIGILIKDIDKIKQYTNNNFYFEEIFFGYKFKNKNSNIFIDIMIYEKNDKNEYKMINNAFENHYFKENELLPLKQKSYSEKIVSVPNNYIEYLNRVYADWDKKIKIDKGHYSDSPIFERLNIPQEFNIDYDNYKYMCYSKLN